MPQVTQDMRRKPLDVSVEGATFNGAELNVMSGILDDVCLQLPLRGATEEREFIAWLVVRLSRNGLTDPAAITSAALKALTNRHRLQG